MIIAKNKVQINSLTKFISANGIPIQRGHWHEVCIHQVWIVEYYIDVNSVPRVAKTCIYMS